MLNLKEHQLNLIRHLAQYEILDYESCLRMLDTTKTNNRMALSYAFRPLTKHKYLKKHKSGVIILAKGRALFPDVKPLVTLGGGATGMQRVNMISRVAMVMRGAGFPSCASPSESEEACFVPSACWCKIHKGILSTTRFAGILLLDDHRLAVYDIGDGSMEWQLRAERSLFRHNFHEKETNATGMLFICDEDKRLKAAKAIIQETMWRRKHLVSNKSVSRRDKPVRYVRTPIRLASQYERVYLTTWGTIENIITAISAEAEIIPRLQGKHPDCQTPDQGDFEAWPYRTFVNIATDLLKHVYFFAALKSSTLLRNQGHSFELRHSIVLPKRDFPILNLYPELLKTEGLKIYEYHTD